MWYNKLSMARVVILETERLVLRQFELSDARHFHELNNDPAVIRYTGDPPFESVEAAEEFIRSYKVYERDGYGRWAVELKANGEFLGFCGLRLDDDGSETDIGFRFHQRHWGKGYATESAKACLEYGLKTLGLKRIIGRAMHENKASIRVLEKLGMRYSQDGFCHGHDAAIYVLEQ